MNRVIKFRACPVLPEHYVVSTDGHVYGGRGQLKEWKDRDGYPHVYLIRNGKRYYRAVHKLVLTAWEPKPTEKHQVNHKNGIRDDNRIKNLEWLTSRENTLHGYRVNGRKPSERQLVRVREAFRGENNPKARLHPAQVAGIRDMRKEGWLLKDIAKNYGVSISQVSAISRNKCWV